MELRDKRYRKDDFLRTFASVLESMFMVDEAVQVNGLVVILDFGGFTMKHQTKLSLEERKQFIQSWQVIFR